MAHKVQGRRPGSDFATDGELRGRGAMIRAMAHQATPILTAEAGPCYM